MQAEFDHPRSDAIVILCVTCAACILVTIVGLVAYLAVQSYDPALSCDEMWGKAFDNSEVPTNLDAWDDYELLCGY